MAPAEAGTAAAPPDEASLVDFTLTLSPKVGLSILLAVGLVIRLALALLPGFGIDVGTFQAWAYDLANTGPNDFYRPGLFADYAPGYLYVLYFLGELNKQFTFTPDQYSFVIKLPSIAADLASAYLIYRLLDDQRAHVRLGAVALYVLFPASLLIGAVWGQVDSLLAFFVLLSIYFLRRGQPIAGGVAYVVAFLVKPQAIAALPFLAFWVLRNYPPRVWVQVSVVSTIAGLAIITPFFEESPWELYDVLNESAGVYPFSAFHSYNFWAIFHYNQSDSVEFLALTHQIWGFILYGASTGIILYSMRRSEGTGALCLGTSLCMLAFYMFVTRMHERYVFGFFLPFLVACVYYRSAVLWSTFAVIASVHFLNLYHAYAEFNQNELRVERFFVWLQSQDALGTGWTTVQVLSFVIFAAFPVVMAATFQLNSRHGQSEAR